MVPRHYLNQLFLRALLFIVAATTSFAANESAQTFNYQGQFFNELGTAPLLDTVDLTLEILDPSGVCLLYSEQQNNINLNTTNGLFAVQVGSLTGALKRTAAPAPVAERDPGLPMELIFTNLGPVTGAIANCAAGYTASAGDGRVLRVIVNDLTTGTTVTLSPDLPIGAAPQAMNAQTLQGYTPSGFIIVDTHMTQATADTLTNASDASALHNHDSLYVKLSSASNQSFGSGNISTTGKLGVGTAAPGARLEADTVTAATIGEIIKGSVAQTADLEDFESSTGVVLSHVDSSGNFFVGANQLATQSDVASAVSAAAVDWTNPGTIGSHTPNTGAFTTLSATGTISIPTTTSSTAGVINQNGSSLLSTFGTANLFFGTGSGNFTNAATLDDTAIGDYTMPSLTAGIENTAVGTSAQNALTSGNYNTAVGALALYTNASGSYNTALGASSLHSATQGFNTAVGYSSLTALTTGNFDTAVGYDALFSDLSGSDNSAVGIYSLAGATSSFNVAFGDYAGYGTTGPGTNAVTSGASNTFIGYNAAPGSAVQISNSTAIGANATVNTSNSLVLGATGTSVGIGTSSPSASSLLNLAAGTATVAPLIVTPGVNLAAPVSGAIENDGTNLYYTDSTNARHALAASGGSGALSGLTSGDIVFASGAASASNSSNLTWNNTNFGINTVHLRSQVQPVLLYG